MPRFANVIPTLCFILGLSALSMSVSVLAQAPEQERLDHELEQLKQETLRLNRDLLILEEELLYPASSQVAVYLSVDLGDFFHLDSVRLQINAEPVASKLYTEQQREALHRGGIQRLYMGNLSSGEHEISAVFTGLGPEGQEYKRAAKLAVAKGQEPLVLELRIVDSARKLQPEFAIKEWALQ